MAYDNSSFLAQVKSRALIPTSQSTYQDQDILNLANDKLHDAIVPMILSARQEYYTVSETFTVTANSKTINIPSRAIGMAIREIKWVQGDNEHDLPFIPIEDSNTREEGFQLLANKLHIKGFTGDVKIYYHLRPGELVETSKAAKIASIDTDANTITVNALPTNFINGMTADFIEHNPGFSTVAWDYTVTGISGTTISFASLPTELAVGNWIAEAEQSPVPQMPVEFGSFLAQYTSGKILEGLGDFEAAQVAESKLKKLEDDALTQISPRMRGETKKITGHRRRG
tara:strand:- start:203 stop:1057 length:855 start_codon:yes stop_codon:yes gene_type:complete